MTERPDAGGRALHSHRLTQLLATDTKIGEIPRHSPALAHCANERAAGL